MDFDPGMFSEEYDDDPLELEESELSDEDVVEYDEVGNPVYLASAAGMGYHMAQDEIEERQIAEDILKRRDGKDDEPVKVPLKARHEETGRKNLFPAGPFQRWAARCAQDPDHRETEIEYTKEEWLAILRAEAE